MPTDTSTAVLPHPDLEDTDFRPPLREDGTSWKLMMSHGEDVVMADNHTALLCHLIGAPYYIAVENEDEAAKLKLRYELAVTLTAHVQKTIVDAAIERGDFDAAELVKTPEGNAHYLALTRKRTVPYDGPEWDGPCALALISTDYEPYTERFAPSRNLWYIDPMLEQELLGALVHFGQVVIFSSEPAVDGG